MHRRPALLSALVVLSVAAPASAGAPRSAKDLALPRTAVVGFHRVVASGLTRGPVSIKNGCRATTTLVTRGGSLSRQTYERVVSRSTDNTSTVVDELSITTVLLPDRQRTTSVLTGLRNADRHCPRQLVHSSLDGVPIDVQAALSTSGAPPVRHAAGGFVETTRFTGTATVNHVSAPVSGASQTMVYQRGRALSLLTLIRMHVTQSTDGRDLISLEYVSDAATRSTLQRLATSAVACLGNQDG